MKELFVLMDCEDVVAIVCEYRGHVFRRTASGRIEKATSQEKQLAEKYIK